MIVKSIAHLKESHISYSGHCLFALWASGQLFYAAVASLVHAIIPALFPATAARIVINLYNIRLKNHPNPNYQSMIQAHDSENAVSVRK